MTDLAPISRLRALREANAARAHAAACARHTAARAAHADALSEIDRHDHDAALREERLHDAMIARGFALADLHDARDRAFHSAADREGLTLRADDAGQAANHAADHADEMARDMRRAMLRHEKLLAAARLLATTRQRRAEALDEEHP